MRPHLLLPLLLTVPFGASADDDMKTLLKELRDQVSELRAQVKESNTRIGELEQALEMEKDRRNAEDKAADAGEKTPTPPAPATITAGDAKGTIKLPGSNTSIGFGGFAKLHMMYSDVDIAKDKWGHQEFYASDIPVGPLGKHGQFNAQAKETRFWFKSYTPSEWGDINTLIELDLDQSASSYVPRLRHAYGSIGNFLAGQTYTTFTNTSALAEIEAATAVGNIVVRQPLVRWTQAIPDTPLDIMLALEFPSSKLTLGTSATIENRDDERFPDFVVRLNSTQDWGNMSLAGMTRQIRWNDPVKGIHEQAWGGAVSLAGRIDIGNRDNLRFMLSYGDALARYVVGGTYADASIDTAGAMSLNTISSGTLFYQHYWNALWRSNLALGYSHADLPSFVSHNLTQDVRSAHINLLWSPLPQATVGLEYLYAMRELQDGRDGDLNRILFSTRFSF